METIVKQKNDWKNGDLISKTVLTKMGYNIDNYPADACFLGDIIGTYSEDRETVCILLYDNVKVEDLTDLNKCILSKEQVKEIAYTVKHLITDFGMDVHTNTFKTVKPFNTLKITKPCNVHY